MRHAILLAILASSAIAGEQKKTVPFPALSEEIPAGPLGDSIRYGKLIATQTQVHAKKFVGNGLNCTSCHLKGGTTPGAAPWVGVWGVFPEYRARSGRVNTLEDRIDDCFRRSLNGTPPENDSDEMRGLLAYIRWLSSGVPTGVEVEGRGFKRLELGVADPAHGKDLYAARCSNCHGLDGAGAPGFEGEYLYPAVWGAKSFNIGAGMARLGNAASFIRHNMPQDKPGTLTNKEALDIAAYFTRMPRPDFAAKDKDWPKGDKPADARY